MLFIWNRFRSIFTIVSISLVIGILVSLVIGLIQYQGREITLESARDVDFKMISNLVETQENNSQYNQEVIKKIIGSLERTNGSAMFNLGYLSKQNCFENGNEKILCKRFPNIETFINEKNNSQVDQYFSGNKAIETANGERFYFFENRQSNTILIGETGEYLHLKSGGKDRLFKFIENIPTYLKKENFNIMWFKSAWAWFTILLTSLFLAIILNIYRNKKESQLTQKENEIDKVTREYTEERESIKNLLRKKNKLNEGQKQKISKLESKIEEEENDHIKTIEKLDMLEKEKAAIYSKLSQSDKAKRNEESRIELNKIKDLWAHHYKWKERYSVESNSINTRVSPFTTSIAFICLERFLRNECRKKSILFKTSKEAIDLLSESNPDFYGSKRYLLHKCRIARNEWVHEGKKPDEDLLENLLQYLEKNANDMLLNL